MGRRSDTVKPVKPGKQSRQLRSHDLDAIKELPEQGHSDALNERETFLTALFDGLLGGIEVRSFRDRQPRQTFCGGIREALSAIERDADDHMNVFVGVATRGDKRDDKGKRFGGKSNPAASQDILDLRRCSCNALKVLGIFEPSQPPASVCR